MATLGISVLMTFQTDDGALHNTITGGGKGKIVGDVNGGGGSLTNGQSVQNIMEIGGILSGIMNYGSINFSRNRDSDSVDILIAVQQVKPIICLLEFVAYSGDGGEDSALLAFTSTDANYRPHTKMNNPQGARERFGISFDPAMASLKYGHRNMRAMNDLAKAVAKRRKAEHTAMQVGQIVGQTGIVKAVLNLRDML